MDARTEIREELTHSAARSGPLVASANDVTQFLVWAFAYFRASMHCLLRHGGGPIENIYHNHIVLCCPVCGRVFWRHHTPA
jgi:hypothetical protein